MKRQRVSQNGRNIIPRRDGRPNSKSDRRENVTQLPIRILNESDPRGTVRIVLDPDHFRDNTALASAKINPAVFLFVPAPDVPRREPAVIIATAGSFLRLNE